MKKERIDKLLFERGLVESRSKAHALVMSGVVLVDDEGELRERGVRAEVVRGDRHGVLRTRDGRRQAEQ